MNYQFFTKSLRKRSIRLLYPLLVLSPVPVFALPATNAPLLLSTKFAGVTGRVLDQDGKPVHGATILIKGSKAGVKTGEDGVFHINLPEDNPVIIVSYVGYKVQEIDMTGKTSITIRLESNTSIDEVVVVGYGTKKRREVLGAVASVDPKEIQDIPAANIAAALRDRVAGLGVSESSGRPGAAVTLNVRNAFASDQAKLQGVTNEPLYVIDGIISSSDVFENLDASMVENISILKDASAAIYGASGAKGVILVTTKRGQIGKTQLSYNGYLGISDATVKPKMLSAYQHAKLLNETFALNNAQPNLFFSDEDLAYLKTNPYKSWYDELWKSSKMERHNLSISGGSEKITFFAGGSYQKEDGNYAGMNQQKYSFRSGFNTEIIEGLKADVAFNVNNTKTNSQNSLSDDRDQNFYQTLITTPQWIPIQIDGMPVNFSNISANSGTNPLAIINSGYYQKQNNANYSINASLNYAPKALKGFNARLQISHSGTSSSAQEYKPAYNVYDFVRWGNNNKLYTNEVASFTSMSASNTKISPSLGKGSSYQGNIVLQYSNTFGQHNLDVMAGAEQSASNSENLAVYWTNQQLLNLDEYWAFDQSSFTNGGRSIMESVKRSFFSRLNYDYKKKYLLEVITRVDASSNFAKGNIWGVFPTVATGWVVSDENFFKDLNYISYLKLRANYGLVGEDRVSARLWQDRFSVDLVNTGYLYGETPVASLNPTIIANPDISWEKHRTFNFGVESRWFDNKLSFGFEYYFRDSYDVFDKGNDENFPMYAGFKAPVVNYQKRKGWGTEFSLGYQNTFSNGLKLSTNMNFGYSASYTTQMYFNKFQLYDFSYPDWKVEMGTDSRKYNSSNYGLIYVDMLRTQQDVDNFLAKNPNYTIDGKVPQVGWTVYEDTNGDGKITEKDLTTMFDNTSPVFSTGITVGLAYKSFSLNTNFRAVFGGKAFYESQAMTAPTETVNVPDFWEDHWSLENPNGKFPRYDDAAMMRKWNSTFWAKDGTTIRINNMVFNWSVPKTFTDRINVRSLKLMLAGNNLWTIVAPFKHRDPYSSSLYNYPTIRTISFGLNFGI
ncbi:SusC/RagA family TonB-linked outer membrane protein [Sphingobacterium sp. B29]|uniref:SusC/RagA family TonB-linked outer membrane protein n=1 Tax=Sphingobacterium sp. B29 TaxID=1933220 RepID=UPI0009FB33B0|nr:SusC/RagA family TonB-linked outer membrane protein [Sphingobacterium sp. B29]